MDDKSTQVSYPLERDSDNVHWIKPKVNTLNPRHTESLNKILTNSSEEGADCVLDLSEVKYMTTVAARMLCKHLEDKPFVALQNLSVGVQNSIEWASEYLYQKGELSHPYVYY